MNSAPCFFSAAFYYILSQLITLWGPQHSPLSASWYLIIFSGADLISIIVQAVGGGSAAKAGSGTPTGDSSIGTHEMLAGIVFQLVSMGAFLFLAVWVLWSTHHVPRSTQLTSVLAATTFSAASVVLRNFYRAVELSQGYSGYLITHEVYFAVLDGALMVLASIVFNFVHPAWGLDVCKGRNGMIELDETDTMLKDGPHWVVYRLGERCVIFGLTLAPTEAKLSCARLYACSPESLVEFLGVRPFGSTLWTYLYQTIQFQSSISGMFKCRNVVLLAWTSFCSHVRTDINRSMSSSRRWTIVLRRVARLNSANISPADHSADEHTRWPF